MFLFKHNPLFHPEEVADKNVLPTKELSKDEIINILDEDEKDDEVIDIKDKEEKKEKKDEKEQEDTEDEQEEEKDELDELEEDLDEPDEEKLELKPAVRRSDILAKYPKLFKDFPFLENSFYRERQFTEIFNTPADAKAAVEKSEILDKFEADLGRGNLETALKAVKSSSDTAFNKLVDDYLPNLAKVDKDAHLHIVGNILRTAMAEMIAESKSSGDTDLEAAAQILNKFAFGNTRIVPPSRLSKGKSEETEQSDNTLETERQQFLQERFEVSRDEVNDKVATIVKNTITANIDPRGSMTDYVKANATRDAQDKLDKMIESDTRLTKLLDKLWEAAAKAKFSKSSLENIKSAYISGARMLLPTAIKQARNEALRGTGHRVKDDNDAGEDNSKKGPLPAGRSTTSHNTSRKSAKEEAKSIPATMSNRDFLMQD